MQKDDRREGVAELSSGCLILCWGCLGAGKLYAGRDRTPSPKPLADKPKKGGGRVALQVQGYSRPTIKRKGQRSMEAGAFRLCNFGQVTIYHLIGR
jgi:hypothetical protein